MVRWPEPPELRRCALAVAVLHDLDVLPAIDGIVLPGRPPVEVPWTECRRALGGVEPETDDGRHRLARWLLLRRWLADRPLEDLVERARPYGACVESPLHPGLDWVRRRVLGDALDIGLGFVGLDPRDPDRVLPVPLRLIEATGADPDAWWPNSVVYLERMGRMAADRMLRAPDAPLRPMGDCDVVTLLASLTLRAAMVADVPDGMRTVAIPMRSRGWLDLNRVDPAFSAAAARLTAAEDRGFSRPLLVTREEVALAPEGGDVLRPAVEDRIAPVIDLRDVMYHRL
ncbi:MAG: hypothetical protein QOJ03_657 [Frankiaceae bacterium]|jgi:hypothetical protein|nr:hypothetical protein [Frankiaceae bacterium]